MWVIKLGGSMLRSPELKHWLDTFACYGNGKIVIVPGGGIFADAVRESQRQSGIDNVTAHRMAVMAMDQYGMLLTGLNPHLVTAKTELEIAERSWQHRAIVWLPSHMVCADESIPADWQVTSDSLAAWLAKQLNAKHLILVKSSKPDQQQVTVDQLIKDGLVDACFSDFTAGQNFSTWVMAKQDYQCFADGISEEVMYKTALPVRCA